MRQAEKAYQLYFKSPRIIASKNLALFDLPIQLPTMKASSTISLALALATFYCSPFAMAEKATDANSIRTKGSRLTIKQVENAYYRLTPWQSGDPDYFVKLKDGVSKKGTETIAVDKIALGDLNKDGIMDAAAIYYVNGGGSGYFERITAFVNKGGRLMAVDNKVLGDRVGIRGLRIKNGVIIADVISHAPTDGAAFPTVNKTARYRLKGGKLIGPDSMYE